MLLASTRTVMRNKDNYIHNNNINNNDDDNIMIIMTII